MQTWRTYMTLAATRPKSRWTHNARRMAFWCTEGTKHKMGPPPRHVVAELARRGLVPPTSTGSACYYSDGHMNVEETGEKTWFEPFRGCPLDDAGFDIEALHSTFGVLNDHVSYICDVERRDGITWNLARAVCTQPYAFASELRALADDVLVRYNVVLTVIETLAWHAPGTTLCVFTPVVPIPEFHLTFRRWLIVHSEFVPGVIDQWSLTPGVLAPGLPPPVGIFFHNLYDLRQQGLGLNGETVEEALAQLRIPLVDEATFASLWHSYRA
jgi:hypothetical protein